MKKGKLQKSFHIDPRLDKVFATLCAARGITMTDQIELLVKTWTLKNMEVLKEIEQWVADVA